ncbi:YihY/virulence factor BrkB family protein [Catenuloplanes atrovinosus]|uniref:Membrane protein n=1 Tax=Catenuloplanes atrovinosus TaxID=137266 RepID=A0AAE4CCZ5_9ACTN|nr:YihY/virulence factor BrkB family protein [Catenuloplanes atrovinosus]MDR7278534.1 membrane protein [Catenuloplanes atrovinosus]
MSLLHRHRNETKKDNHDKESPARSDAKDAPKDDAGGGPVPPEAGPDSPAQLSGNSLWNAVKRTIAEFQDDNLSDWAAALTYYGVLSIFPGLLVLAAVLGLLGDDTLTRVVDSVRPLLPAETTQILESMAGQLSAADTSSGLIALVGLAGAFWSASGYVGAFMRASNAIYEVPEGRPVWKTLPIRVGVTALVGLMLIACAVIVVFTGGLADRVGSAIGLGEAAVTVWDIAKWPVLLVIVSLMFAVLYWASPNAKTGGFRWVTPGGFVAVLLWVVASAGFGFYVANFGSYNKTYGTLAGIIVFLVWLWISNIAILFGAEMDAELERRRAIAAGTPPDKEPFLELRDDRKVKK